MDDGEAKPGTNRPRPSHSPAVLIAIILLALSLRAAVTGLSPLLPRVSADVVMTASEVGLLGALPPFCFAAAALTGPLLLRRLAAERLVLVALALSAAGQLARPWAPSVLGFLGASVVALLGMGTGNVVLPVLVKAWFPRWIGYVTAVYVSAVTLGTALPPLLSIPVANAVADRSGSATTGWQVSLAWWGALAGLVLLPWLGPALHPRALPAPRTAEARRPRLAMHRSRTARGVLLVFGITSLNAYALFAWLPVRLVDAGVSDGTAAEAVAAFAAVGIPASLIVPILAARLRSQFPLVTVFAVCMVIGISGLVAAPTRVTLLWSLICGAGTSGFPLALALVGLRTRTPGSAGQLSGFAQGFGYLGAGLGPLGVGALHDLTGGWGAPFAVLGATQLLLVLGGWLAGRRGTVEDDLEIPELRPDTLRR